MRRLGLWDNTIICLWGDHGYKLGDYQALAKHGDFELDTRVPLIMRVPGLTDSGARTDALVETVDMMPTLLDLAGLPTPADVEGTSFAPLLRNPRQPWKSAAFSRWRRIVGGEPLMGDSVRTRRYRYTEWVSEKSGEVRLRELYDHRVDALEMNNIVADPAHADQVRRLSALRKAGWRAARPGSAPI